jgi:hypothetical protein
MKIIYCFVCTAMLVALLAPAQADDRIKLETTIIKGNKEMPQIVYIVPWKDSKPQAQKEQTLVLHSLFGNLFDPLNPDATAPQKLSASSTSVKNSGSHRAQ